MPAGSIAVSTSSRWLRPCALLAMIVALACSLTFSLAKAETAPVPTQSQDVKSFLDLLAKPDVQKWLTDQGTAQKAAEEPNGRPADGSLFTTQISDMRRHIAAVLEAAPQLPGDLALAMQLIKV